MKLYIYNFFSKDIEEKECLIEDEIETCFGDVFIRCERFFESIGYINYLSPTFYSLNKLSNSQKQKLKSKIDEEFFQE